MRSRAGLRRAVAVGLVAATCLSAWSAGDAPHGAAAGAGNPPQAGRFRDWPAAPDVDPGEVHGPVQRIVSAAPSVTEICCALGLREQLVGRTRYCRHPPGITAIPSIGALTDTNVELLLELRPDLVIVSGTSRAMVERIGGLGLRIESVPDRTLEDLFTAIRRVGELTGRPRTAERLCRAVRSELEQAAAGCRCRGHRVLLVTGRLRDPPAPPFVAGPGSFYDDLLRLAGHRNVLGEQARGFGPVSLEYILGADPDVIVELDPDGASGARAARESLDVWEKVGPLRAVRQQRVRVLIGPEHFLCGPRVARTLEALCAAIEGQAP